jgi:sterol 3beta-glucosyltransferase
MPRLVASGRSRIRLTQRIMAAVAEPGIEGLRGAERACVGADAIIHHPLAWVGAFVGVKHRIPVFTGNISPTFPPTAEFPHSLGWRAPAPLDRLFVNRLTYLSVGLLSHFFLRKTLAAWTKELGIELKELARNPPRSIHAWSPNVLSAPRDWNQATDLVSGFWFLDPGADGAGWTPPPDLLAFLEAGPPPVYVGFGSMVVDAAERDALTKVVVSALLQTGQRAVLATGWGGIDRIAAHPSIKVIDEAPFTWLFPRMSAAVHHCGVGTLAASVVAGIPVIAVPFFADQFFWAARVEDLGIGRPLDRSSLDAASLANALVAVANDAGVRDRARELGQRVRAEEGTENAVDFVLRNINAP